MDPYLRDVLDVCIRMLHVVAGIAWIGASFYFVRLDLALRPPKRQEDAETGVAGEFWGVHGGGLYHSQKYRLAPAEMPEPLHWFKWEAYTTWLSGFALLVVLYYLDADVRLVDPQVADLDAWQAVALSIGGAGPRGGAPPPAPGRLGAARDEKREPDPAPPLRAKTRSVHNNYLTLPVLFTMLVGH